ncbi:hypothetical protein [Marinobacter nauticus]|uniref:hypothetical protein n=1 Tax=Marinobacter nauticus TaxID=2743 RepID=UPI00404408A4
MAAKTIHTELGKERCCTKCGDYWPEDSEFFYSSRGVIQQPCKACYAELPSRKERKANEVKAQKLIIPVPCAGNISLRAHLV